MSGGNQTLTQLGLYNAAAFGNPAATVAIGIVGTNNRFTTAFEATGRIIIAASDGETLEVTIANADMTEPYVWVPSNGAEVITFINHVRGLTDNNATLTLTDDPAVAVPDTPAAPTFTNITHNRATGNWVEPNDNGADITSYDLEWRQGSSGAWTEVSDLTGVSHTLTSLSAETIYQVRVRATNSAGDSDWSENGQFQTLQQPTSQIQATTASGAPTVAAQVRTTTPVTIDSIPAQTGERVRMLITAGQSNRLYSRRGDVVGSVSADSDLTLTDSITVDRIQVNPGSNWVRVFGNNAVDGLFGSGGVGESADVMIATPYGDITLTDVDTVLTGYGQWTTTSAQSDTLSQIQVGDMVLLVVYGFAAEAQVQATASSGSPTAAAQIRTTPPPKRIQASTSSGIPVAQARVRLDAPVATQVQASVSSGVPIAQARVRTTMPGSAQVMAAVTSGVPNATAQVRTIRMERVRASIATGIPAAIAQVRTTAPGESRVRADASSGAPSATARVRIITPTSGQIRASDQLPAFPQQRHESAPHRRYFQTPHSSWKSTGPGTERSPMPIPM